MSDLAAAVRKAITSSPKYRHAEELANRHRVDDGAGGCIVCDAEPGMWCDGVVHRWPAAWADVHEEPPPSIVGDVEITEARLAPPEPGDTPDTVRVVFRGRVRRPVHTIVLTATIGEGT